MKKHIVSLVCTLTIASSVSAQICGQRFDADLSVDYDAVVKYYHQDGTLRLGMHSREHELPSHPKLRHSSQLHH